MLEINLWFKPYWDFLDEEVAKANLKTGVWPGHAQEFETAFAMAAFPDNVRHDAMQDQEDRSPQQASGEAGQAMIDSIVSHTSDFLAGMIAGTQVAEIPDFH